MVMEPLRELMKQHLDMSGTRWEDQQLHQAVADDIAGTDSQRQLRVTVAADMELETKCLEAVRLLLTEAPLWSELPTPCLHVAHRCLIFRMVSRIGCCVEQMLRAQHRSLPIALFRFLRTQLRRSLMATPENPLLLECSLLEGVPRPLRRRGVGCLDGHRRTVQGRHCADRVPPRRSAAVPEVTDADPRDELRRTVRALCGTAAPQKTRHAPSALEA